MPIYEYKCDVCGKHVEKVQTSYEPVQEYLCPETTIDLFCGSDPSSETAVATEFRESPCGGKMKLQISIPAEADSTLGYPRWNENMGHEPVYVEGRAHRRDVMRERGISDASKAGAQRFGGNF